MPIFTFRLALLFSLLVAAVTTTATADPRPLPPEVRIETKLPAWVQPVTIDFAAALEDNADSSGIRYLLSDLQDYAGRSLSFRRVVYKFISSEGVENNSAVSLSIDPDYQTLVWHKLALIRDGETIDLLSRQDFRVSRKQGDTSNLVYDNSLECLAIIEDSRKGDILEYAYSIEGANPVTTGQYSEWFPLDFGVPVERLHVRILRDAGLPPLRFLSVPGVNGGVPAPTAERSGDTLSYTLDRAKVTPVSWDYDVPGDYSARAYLQVSDWDSWSEVAQWGVDLYDFSAPDSSELAARIDQWRRLRSPEDQVLAALRWVQEEIRYVAITVGPHNYKPYKIPQILARKFGDCKDKSLLLTYILRELGIRAVPVLVNTVERGLIAEYLPTPNTFDHVITRVELGDGEFYWLDPTNSGQGGPLHEIWHADYGRGLPLDAATTALVSVPGQGAEVAKTHVREVFKMKNYSGTLRLSVFSRYTGQDADSMRRYFKGESAREIEKSYMNFYAQSFAGIKSLGAPTTHDDFDRNVFDVKEEYLIQNGWTRSDDSPGKRFFGIYPELIDSQMYVSGTRIRTMPAAQTYPLDFTQVVVITLPEPGNFAPESKTVETPWFRFDYTVATEGDDLLLTHKFKTLTAQIPAKDYQSYAAQLDTAFDSLGYSIEHTDGEQEVVSSEAPFYLYLPSALTAGFSAVLGLIAFCWIVTRKQTPPRPPVNPDLDGISGWLILPALGVVISPFILLTGFVELKDAFDSSFMNWYADPTSEGYVRWFTALLLAGLGWNSFAFVLFLALPIVFFRKRAITRPLYIGLMTTHAILILAEALALEYVSAGTLLAEHTDAADTRSAIAGIIRSSIWIIYFAVSVRVKSTFRR